MPGTGATREPVASRDSSPVIGGAPREAWAPGKSADDGRHGRNGHPGVAVMPGVGCNEVLVRVRHAEVQAL